MAVAQLAAAVAQLAVAAVQWAAAARQQEEQVDRWRDRALAAAVVPAVVHSPGEPGREVLTTVEIRSAEEEAAAAG